MPHPCDDGEALLTRRLALVGEAAALTRETLRLDQTLRGIEIDLLRLTDAIERYGASAALQAELGAVDGRAEAIEHRRAVCQGRIEAVTADIDVIDRLLAGRSGAEGGTKR